MPSSAEQAFWARFRRSDSGCLEWQGAVQRYGKVNWQGRMWRVHRLAWTLTYGPIPVGMLVCHHCDNKVCAEPTHLFLGTHSDNMRDFIDKGFQRIRPTTYVRHEDPEDWRSYAYAMGLPPLPLVRLDEFSNTDLSAYQGA